jgi:hypothetical protein
VIFPVDAGMGLSVDDHPSGVLIHGSGFAGEGAGVLKAGVMAKVGVVLCGG